MKTEIFRRKLYFGVSLMFFFSMACAFSFSPVLKNALQKIETYDSISGITFKVQVGSYKFPIEQFVFLREEIGDNFVLTHGIYESYQEAVKARDSLQAAGFKDAWIPMYLHENRSDLSQIAGYLSGLDEPLHLEEVDENMIQSSPEVISASGFFQFFSKGENDTYLQKIFFMQGEQLYYSYFLYAIIIFLGTTLSLIVTLITHRSSIKTANAKKKIVQRKINGFLMELILDEDLSEQMLEEKLAEFRLKIPFNKDWCKELLIKNIIDLKKNFKGEMSTMFITIYLKLDLLSYSEDLIKNKVWYEKTKGIFHFEELDYSKGLPLITPFIKHKNKALKSVALIAHISLKEENSLDIFNDYQGHIDQVDELKILDTIKKKKLKIPDNIQNWLKSDNPSLVLLTIKMISYFNHLALGEALLELLQSPNEEIRRNVIIASRQLYLVQAEDRLINSFHRESNNNQTEMIKTLAAIGSSATEEFLGELVELTDNREIKIEAMKALKEMNSMVFHSTFNHNVDLQLVKLHVEDPYIL
ncbi:MAG TPA: HEAT repeat domain-containing protein [Anditalea sp.]|nr:HEAT repeat domain-containing protein [Anditalea sp.]